MDGNMQGNMQGNMYQPNIPQKTPDFTKWIIISVAQMACCCQITGILCLVMTILADSDFKKGLYNEYNNKMKTVKIATIIGVIVGFIVSVAYLGLVGLDLFLELS